MAVLSRSYGYLFIQAPRTGCTAIAEGVLYPYLDGVDIPPEDVYDAHGRLVLMRKHCKLSELTRHGALTEDEAGRLFTFSAVRNPFDSLVSLYVKMRSEYAEMLDDGDAWVGRDPRFVAGIRFAMDHTFPEWVEYRLGRSRARSLASKFRTGTPGGSHVDGMDFVMRFECLQEDFNAVLHRMRVREEFLIPRINPTEGREGDYRAYYNPRARKIVERAFRDRLDRFGYSF
ncbi:MAG: sulfotransferase family 2 domain-containing protein [Acidimicrobiia bacterium]